MKDKILIETATFCEKCPNRECCKEEECVLYRIEQLVVNDEDNASNKSKKEEK